MDTSTNLGLGLIVTLAVTVVMVAFVIVGALINRIAAHVERAGDQ